MTDVIPASILERYSPEEIRDLLELATPEEAQLIRDALQTELAELPRWAPLPYQRTPLGLWRRWLFLGGRGTGKSATVCNWFNEQMELKPTRGRIIAPTLGDARESCVDGVSGLLVLNPQINFNRSMGILTWPNGSRARLFGAHTPDDVERLRAGGNSEVDIFEELAAWRMLDQAYEQADFGLRLGANPRAAIATTPKPRPLLKQLIAVAQVNPAEVSITKASTRDNVYLDADVRRRLEERYAGTRLGRQELDAELLDDVEGALWTWEELERCKVTPEEIPTLRRIVVAVDPSWGTTGDECGVVVAGVGWDRRIYVLDDKSVRATPSEWGRVVAAAYREYEADRVIAEVNFQAEQVRLVMKTTDPTIPFKEVRASKGKVQRAEPVVALYQQGKVSHVTGPKLAGLEAQMCEWVPPAPGTRGDVSPDRVDALVWCVAELGLGSTGPAKIRSAEATRLPGVVSLR